ncbi:MAG: sulfate ABC transporter permease subunit CysT [Microbacteriaceae bacterium]|nr:sulfate ABC transporter permease subunit CysT [Microbacteriaceae bacterium]
MSLVLKRRSVLPGFGLTVGYALLYLSLIVLIPLASLFLKTATTSWSHIWETISDPRAIAAYRLTFGAAFAAAAVNAFFGLLLAWVLVRYRFPGRKLIDALVDLPFALPTAVAGIALTTIYAPSGWVGRWLEPLGIEVAFQPLGITVALVFIGVPFVVRTLQPVLESLDAEVEEAAASLGARRWQTIARVILPELWPALLAGFSMAFARAIGEYGSVVFISGNKIMKNEIVPLLIMMKLDQYDYPGATSLAMVMLVASFVLLLTINVIQWWSARRHQPKPA